MLRSTMMGLLAALAAAQQQPEPLRVCATTPDLGALVAAVGGERVAVTTLVRGPEDPHFLEARPSMVKALAKAEVLVEVGLELEIGWLPVLVDNARNGAVLAGAPGRIVAADAVSKLGVPAGPVDRSHGDVHAGGNPHFLTDPCRGLQVATLVAQRLAAVRPADKDWFAARLRAFRERLAVALVGKEVAALYEHDAERLGALFAADRLRDVLGEHGDAGKLGGWCAALQPFRGARVVVDHDLWPYFLERFGLATAGCCEPRPGIAPTSAHLESLIAAMRRDQIGVILASPFFAPQHGELLVRKTGARLAPVAHQCGGRPGTDDYIDFVDHNVRALVAALAGKS